jgi:hypothetical protein
MSTILHTCLGTKGYTLLKNELTIEEQEHVKKLAAYVPESVVTDEIREDLKKLGWIAVPWDDEDE